MVLQTIILSKNYTEIAAHYTRSLVVNGINNLIVLILAYALCKLDFFCCNDGLRLVL